MFEMIDEIIQQIYPSEKAEIVEVIKSGLINQTYKIRIADRHFALQTINKNVFKDPSIIHENLERLNSYIILHQPDYKLNTPLSDSSGNSLFIVDDVYYRLFDWVEEGVTIDTVKKPEQAYEAAKQFAAFTKVFEDFDTKLLIPPIINFHNLPLRYNQFNDSLYHASEERRYPVRKEVGELLDEFSYLVGVYNEMTLDPRFKLRVMHHDAKISNVLFDKNDKGLYVIDLDTVMPGFILSDWGDMMRTYISPANEEETDLEKVFVRKEYIEAIQAGYLEVLGNTISKAESGSLINSGMVIIYMQALRFLADHLNQNIYYGADYDGQNYYRAINQIKLLRELQRFAKEQK